MKYGESVEGLEWLSENVVIFQGHKTKLTPMIDQYLDAKKQNPNAVLFFRMGDFYECFFDDAKTVSKALDLVLTARTKNEDGDDLPMAGVPVRSVNEYLFQLVEQGFRVAICEQLELPTPGVSLVKRGITQVVTPGTLCDERPGFDKSARFYRLARRCRISFEKTPFFSNFMRSSIARFVDGLLYDDRNRLRIGRPNRAPSHERARNHYASRRPR